MTDNLTPLIERVEAASEGSRDLDFAIATALFGEPYTFEDVPWETFWKIGGDDVDEADLPRYSTAVDGAMTLIPDGMIWMLTNSGVEHPTKPDFTRATAVVDRWQSTAPMKECEAASPALALCLASLRALQHQEAGHGG